MNVIQSPARHRRRLSYLAVALVLLGGSACLVRTRKPQAGPVIARTASLEELLAKLRRFESIDTLKSRVNLQLSFLTEDQEGIKEYSNVRGLILISRPDRIRVQAQVPVVGTTAFEMASDGTVFRVHLPTKRRFLEGKTALDQLSENRVENVRPQHILQALLITPPQQQQEEALLENMAEGRLAYHVVQVIRLDVDGHALLSRKFWFDRTELNLARQEVFEPSGNLVTVAYYREWNEGGTALYPGLVYIDRKKEGYQLTIRILEPGLNEPVPENAFVLEPPPDVKVEPLGEAGRIGAAESQ